MSNKLFKDFETGLGLNFWYEQNPYTETNNQPRWTAEAQNIVKHVKFSDAQNFPIWTTTFRYRESGQDPGASSDFVSSQIEYSNDEYVNKTTLIDIIEYLQKWKATWVDYSDFAYLKNLGVFPSNRLMIARRFATPTPNNLYEINDTPMATMISWITEENPEFFKITFGEEWEDVREASFTSILNSVGEDLGRFAPKALGNVAQAGFNVFNLGGWSEGIQIKIAQKLGLVTEYDNFNPPSGNPNLIKQAMQRSLVPKDQSGAGLNSSFSISFSVEYEQKFLNGLNPSLVYLDIIHKALIFGTSKSISMFGGVFTTGTSQFIKDLISGDVGAMVRALFNFIGELKNALLEVLGDILTAQQGNQGQQGGQGQGSPSLAQTLVQSTFSTIIGKYRIKLFGVIHALTGAPSGYWHVTLGNPKKPFFSSGDLITSGVSISFGKILSYNDLPSTLKIDFTMIPTRNLGGQEIMDRFNTGQGRTYYQRKRSYVESVGELYKDDPNNPVADVSQVEQDRRQRYLDTLKSKLELKIDGNDATPGPKN